MDNEVLDFVKFRRGQIHGDVRRVVNQKFVGTEFPTFGSKTRGEVIDLITDFILNYRGENIGGDSKVFVMNNIYQGIPDDKKAYFISDMGELIEGLYNGGK